MANRQAYKDKARKHTLSYRKWWSDYKSTLFCSSCGEDHPATLDFHHTSDDKEHTIGHMVGNELAKDRVMKEVGKCIVLCSNCHRKLHWNENSTGKNK